MTYSIIKSTEKAYNIEADGVTTWIPKTWIKKDGSLSVKALDKITDEKNNADYKKESSSFDLIKRIENKEFVLVKESEKALNICFFDGNGRTFLFWVPKSMTTAMWFVQKKLDEAHANYIL